MCSQYIQGYPLYLNLEDTRLARYLRPYMGNMSQLVLRGGGAFQIHLHQVGKSPSYDVPCMLLVGFANVNYMRCCKTFNDLAVRTRSWKLGYTIVEVPLIQSIVKTHSSGVQIIRLIQILQNNTFCSLSVVWNILFKTELSEYRSFKNIQYTD